MPLYEFECEDCHKRFERIQKFTDPTPDVCPTCGKGPVRKLFSSPAIQFKGSGFYITDYAKKSTSEAGGKSSSSGEGSASSDAKGETKAADTKSSDTKSTASESKPAAKKE
jgi:putative FmdB family regulatory protein